MACTTMCTCCGSIEHTLASINTKCFFCKKGQMKLMELYSPE